MEISKESWDAMVSGQVRDNQRIMDLQERLCKMARQVEKLSFMVEMMDMIDCWSDEAEGRWPEEQARRAT